jgi:hypothetical protein
VLTGSLDKSIVVSTNNEAQVGRRLFVLAFNRFCLQNVVMRCDLKQPVWCCEWNADDSNYFFCGAKTGARRALRLVGMAFPHHACLADLFMFDLRMPKGPVGKSSIPAGPPLHSLCYAGAKA